MSQSVAGFEPDFAERLAAQWGRGPQVFRDVLSEPFFTGRDLMTAMLGAARDFLADPTAASPPGRIYLAGELVKPDRLAPFLPRGAAETFDDYAARIRQAHPDRAIGIVIDNCEKHVPVMRDGLVPILHRLFSRVGYPARRNHLCLYAGNYRSTPFGIHRDDCHVLMFCGINRKAMAFWPRPYFEAQKGLFAGGTLRARLDDHIAHATVLEMGPRDVLYWSDNDWHVAVSDTDDFHGALSVGIYYQGSSGELMRAMDFLTAATAIGTPDIPGLPRPSNGRLSADALRAPHMAAFFDRWRQIQDVTSRAEEAEYRALSVALRMVSSAGYGTLRTPAPTAPPALDGTVLRCAVTESVVVARIRGGLMVGANGSRFFCDQAVPALDDAVLKLCDGMPHRFESVVGAGDAVFAAQMTAVLRDLITAGVLSCEADGFRPRRMNGVRQHGVTDALTREMHSPSAAASTDPDR